MELNPDSSLDNGMGLLHGGTAAAMLDTAMGAAANTMLPPDKAVLTLDLKLTYLRPLRLSSGPIRATGKVLTVGKRNAYVSGEVHDGKGRLAVHAVAIFSVISTVGGDQRLGWHVGGNALALFAMSSAT